MTDDMMQANQVPLTERLRSVPAKAHLTVNTPNPLGSDTQHFAIGEMCHRAAARLDALRVELDERTRERDEARTHFAMVAMHFPDGDMTIGAVKRQAEEWLREHDAAERERREAAEKGAERLRDALAVTGYRQLNEQEPALMNEIKAHGVQLGALVEKLRATQWLDQRWVSIGATDLQTGTMALVRAVAQPTTF